MPEVSSNFVIPSHGGRAGSRMLILILERGEDPRSLAHPSPRVRQLWGDMNAVRQAVALDTVERLVQLDVADVMLCSRSDELLRHGASLGAHTHRTDGSFLFLPFLKERIRALRPESMVVLGGAALPVVPDTELRHWLHELAYAPDETVWAHGFLSPDMVGWRPAEALLRVEKCATDNALGAALRDQAGLQPSYWQRVESWPCDLDTPVDALLLRRHPLAGRRLREIEPFDGHRVPLDELAEIYNRPDYPELALIGRVSPKMVQFINDHRALRVRVFSEERGMKGMGRDVDGKAASLLEPMVSALGWPRFFEELARRVHGVWMDTRVLLAARRAMGTETDRFLSDLGWYEEIETADIRAMTRAAVECPIPAALGGHALVAGGLRAFLDTLGPGPRRSNRVGGPFETSMDQPL